jgi:hypothetical protein
MYSEHSTIEGSTPVRGFLNYGTRVRTCMPASVYRYAALFKNLKYKKGNDFTK